MQGKISGMNGRIFLEKKKEKGGRVKVRAKRRTGEQQRLGSGKRGRRKRKFQLYRHT
jgi:hypothetical protein